MPVGCQLGSCASDLSDPKPALKDVVIGLHWDPPQDGVRGQAADLDALCVMFDSRDGVLEVVHPGHPRGADDSVIHTGDSRTGASAWDDERIFVFLQALPQAVAKLAVVVLSATGQQFAAVPGAYCHVSDRASEIEWAHVELTSLFGRTAYTVAILRRTDSGWNIASDVEQLESRLLADLRLLALAK